MESITSPPTSHFLVEPGGSISITVADCRANFKRCVQAMKSDEDDIFAGILEELQSKFLSWTSYLGVFADSQACLDRRLERHPQYRDLVLWVLDTLNMNLLHMITAIGLDNSDSDDSSDDEPDRRKAELSGIQSSVNELNRLAIYIRQSSMSSLEARVKAFRSRKPGEIWRFQIVADNALRSLYPLASESLRQQLSSSMVDRYARLLYWNIHDRKLRTDRRRGGEPDDSSVLVPTEQMKATMPIQTRAARSQNCQIPPKSGDRGGELEIRPASGVGSSLSGTIPSNLGSQLLLPPAESEPPGRKRANASTLLETGGNFPKPPSFGTGEDLKPCPLCRKLLKRIDCFDEKWWRHHVNEDLTPFHCISRTCSQFPKFSSRTDWLEHMSMEHGAFWQQYQTTDPKRSEDFCPICCMTLYDKKSGNAEGQSSATVQFAQQKHKLPPFRDTATQQTRPRTVHFDISSGDSSINAPAATKSTLGLHLLRPVQTSTSKPRERPMMDHIAGHLQFLALLVPKLSGESLTSGNEDAGNFGSDVNVVGSFDGKRSTLDDSLENLTSNTSGKDEAENWYKQPAPEKEKDDKILQYPKSLAQISLASDHGKDFMEFSPLFYSWVEMQQSLSMKPTEGSGGNPSETKSNPGKSEKSEETRRLLKDLEDLKSKLKPIGSLFVPISHLQELINEPRLHGILRQHRSIDINILSGMVTFILRYAIKIFAILVWIGKTECIEDFCRAGLTDDMLPVSKTSGGVLRTMGLAGQQTDEKTKDIFFTDAWSSTSREEWWKAQWIFLAPVFDDDQFRYSIPDQCPLPVVKYGSEVNDLFNHVQACEIHWSHYRHAESVKAAIPNVPVVIKNSKNPKGFDQSKFDAAVKIEARTLERIKVLNHRHLIKPLAYFTRKGSHYFVFSGADRGNLRGLFNKVSQPERQKYTRWFYRQTFGLAQAIEAMHASPTTQLHKALRPEHIVCLKGSSPDSNPLLVISGIGLADLRDIVDKSQPSKSQALTGRGSVILCDPPEQEGPSPPSLRWDIWSIGCIYLEMIIWFLYGSPELERFRSSLVADRKVAMFYEYSNSPDLRGHTSSNTRVQGSAGGSSSSQKYPMGVPVVHHRVRFWIQRIRSDARFEQDTASRRFIDLIRDRLLVPEVSSRADSAELRTNLGSIYHEVMEAGQMRK